jgi:hypothetical protein
LLPLLRKEEKDVLLRGRVNQMLLSFMSWTHGKPIHLNTYHAEIAAKLNEFLVASDLYVLYRNLEAAGHIRPETLLFSIFGFPDRVTIRQ